MFQHKNVNEFSVLQPGFTIKYLNWIEVQSEICMTQFSQNSIIFLDVIKGTFNYIDKKNVQIKL